MKYQYENISNHGLRTIYKLSVLACIEIQNMNMLSSQETECDQQPR